MVVDFQENEDENSLFDCDYVSIDEVINKVIIFTSATERDTENGARMLIAFQDGEVKSAFYTSSKRLKDAFFSPNQKYPFRAIIKVVRCGNMSGFKVFSPSCKITNDDLSNFTFYSKNKYKKR